LIEAAALYLYFTIRYFFPLRKWVSTTLFIVLVCNPVTLYMGNYISSDACFAALSLAWFGHLIWIVQRPAQYDWLISGVLFFCILGLRYNALYYPFVLGIAYLLSKQVWWRKLAGIGFTCLLLVLFIIIVRNENYQKTGTKTFSSFNGWQMAANALYLYPHIRQTNQELLTADMQKLDRFIQHYFDTLTNKQLPPLTSTMLLWGDSMPLKRYWYDYISEHKTVDSMKAWFALEPLYGAYGQQIILHNPVAFTQHFLLPNLKEYIKPNLEVFNQYNLGQTKHRTLSGAWFRHDTTLNMRAPLRTLQKNILSPFPWLFTLTNVLLLAGVGTLLINRTRQQSKTNSDVLYWLLASFVVINLGFSVLAAPVVFRYQYVPMALGLIGCLLIANRLWQPKQAIA